jgi:hypothetical protein
MPDEQQSSSGGQRDTDAHGPVGHSSRAMSDEETATGGRSGGDALDVALTELTRAIARAAGELAASERSLPGILAEAEAVRARVGELRRSRDAALEVLAGHEAEAERLAAEHRETLPVLAAWSEADAALAEGMGAAGFPMDGGALEAAITELGSVRERLAMLDSILRPLLEEHARAYEVARQIRSA